MQYWHQLMALESAIIESETPKSLVHMMIYAVENEGVNADNLLSVLYHIDKLMEKNCNDLQNTFDILFGDIRTDTHKHDYSHENEM
jgi:hypothetical protein